MVNRLVRAWLRSRWHLPVSSSMMVLTFDGVRSGKTYSFPVGDAEEPDGQLTFPRLSWWKNFREEKPVSLRLRGREVQGTAAAVRDPEAVAERFAYYLKRNPHDGGYFGVRVGRDGRTDPGEVTRAAGSLVMSQSRLDETRSPCWEAVVEPGTALVCTWLVISERPGLLRAYRSSSAIGRLAWGREVLTRVPTDGSTSLGLDAGYEVAVRFARTRSGASGEIRPMEAACSAAAAESATATIVVPIPSTSAAILPTSASRSSLVTSRM